MSSSRQATGVRTAAPCHQVAVGTRADPLCAAEPTATLPATGGKECADRWASAGRISALLGAHLAPDEPVSSWADRPSSSRLPIGGDWSAGQLRACQHPKQADPSGRESETRN